MKRIRMPIAILLLLALVSVGSAITAANHVPVSGLGEASIRISANQLKPSECAGIDLTNVITGSGNINGTSANDLILGSPARDTITGGKGNDCILGGAGNDTLNGEHGNDILMGGPGFDTCLGMLVGNDQSYGCEFWLP
ncbi:MAG: hypothetical protein WA110_07420 [Anaerolineaceae bacterium]